MLKMVHEISLHPYRKRLGDIAKPIAGCIRYLKQHGAEAISPVLVMPALEGGGLWVLSGEKWWVAAQAAAIEYLPVTIFNGDEAQALDLLRADYASQANPMELAWLVKRLLEEEAPRTVTSVARQLMMDRSTVAHHLRLLALVPELQAKIESGVLNLGKAKPLVGLPPGVQRKVADRIQGPGWTVRRVEELVAALRNPEQSQRVSERLNNQKDADSVRLERVISERLGMPARINWNNGQGSLTLDFVNSAILEGVLERLGIVED